VNVLYIAISNSGVNDVMPLRHLFQQSVIDKAVDTVAYPATCVRVFLQNILNFFACRRGGGS